MSKLENCQFVEIKIDKTAVSGSSEESTYKGWLEAYSPPGLTTIFGKDGVHFDVVRASILMTEGSTELFEKYLKRGYKEIDITIVYRGSDKFDQNYEVLRIVYENCNFHSLNIELREHLFMDVMFSFDKSVACTFNVPNNAGDALAKMGPITYSIPQKNII